MRWTTSPLHPLATKRGSRIRARMPWGMVGAHLRPLQTRAGVARGNPVREEHRSVGPDLDVARSARKVDQLQLDVVRVAKDEPDRVRGHAPACRYLCDAQSQPRGSLLPIATGVDAAKWQMTSGLMGRNVAWPDAPTSGQQAPTAGNELGSTSRVFIGPPRPQRFTATLRHRGTGASSS